MQNLQIFRLVRKLQAAVEIGEQTQVGRIADELAGNALEIPNQFLRSVGGTIVHYDNPIRAERLPRNGFERLADEGFAVEDGDGCDDF